MSRFDFWTQRLAEVTMDATLTKNPEHRILYLELAEHYSLMARICAKTSAEPCWDERDAGAGRRFIRASN
jgi:hypothetical protein